MQLITTTIKSKQFIAIMLVVLATTLCLIASSCANSKQNESQDITDVCGQKLNTTLPVNKAVSAHNPTLNHLIVLGNGSSKFICGFGRKDIASNLYSKILPDWNNLEIVGNDSTPVNKETIINLNPDLIILPEYNWQTKEKDYEGLNIPIFVCFPNKESIESVISTLEVLAKLFSQEDRANLIKNNYYQIIDEVNRSIECINFKPRAAFFGPRTYTIATSNMLQNQIINAAGGQTCIPNFLEDHFATVEPETIINMNPEYIFIPSYAEYSVADVTNDPKLSNVEAVKNGHVYKFPCNLEPWDMPTCSSALGIAWLTSVLHPDCYSKEKLLKNAVSFYKLLYNYDFSEIDFEID